MKHLSLIIITTVLLRAINISGQALAPSSSVAANASVSPLVLKDGTAVKLKTGRSVSSVDARVGDIVNCEVIEEIHLENTAIIPKGAAALATVTAVQHKRGIGRGAKVDISIEYVQLANGNKAPLRAAQDMNGTAQTASRVVISPVSLRGKEVTIPQDTEFTAYVNGEFPVNASATPGAGLSPGPSFNRTTELNISSIPSGAELSVDERIVGATPLRVIVGPGDHTIAIRQSGYMGWTRVIHVSGENMKIDATLARGANADFGYDSSIPLPTCAVASGCPNSSLGAAGRMARAKRTQQGNQSESKPKQ